MSEKVEESSTVVVTVQFQDAGRPYNFSAPVDLSLEPGAWVVVKTVYGTQAGQILTVDTERPESASRELKPVLRRATGLDMARYQALQQRAERLVEVTQEELDKTGQQKQAKVVSAEFTLDGDQAVVFYTGGISGKQRSTLRRRVASRMNCRISLRSIGPRDQAKMLGGYGVCGEQRCCTRFLTEFQAVSIRMAKDQAISMAPTDITGMCGRLRCCLAYEHAVYKEASKGFPKRKSHVKTAEGIGRVIDWDVLNEEVVVEIPPHGPRRDRQRYRFPVDEVERVKR
jgi:cell fate regulator YaaT (PSP1 superfamily)